MGEDAKGYTLMTSSFLRHVRVIRRNGSVSHPSHKGLRLWEPCQAKATPIQGSLALLPGPGAVCVEGGGAPAAASRDSRNTPSPRKLLSLHWPGQEESGERAACGSGNTPRMLGRRGKEVLYTFRRQERWERSGR